jgi:hypothetical protein
MVFTYGGQQYEVHTNQDGSQVVLCGGPQLGTPLVAIYIVDAISVADSPQTGPTLPPVSINVVESIRATD